MRQNLVSCFLIICSVKPSMYTPNNTDGTQITATGGCYQWKSWGESIKFTPASAHKWLWHGNLSLSDTGHDLMSALSRGFSAPLCLSFHGYSESALGLTPEPCYATAPNNGHLLPLLSVHHLTGRSLCLHMIIYSDSPAASPQSHKSHWLWWCWPQCMYNNLMGRSSYTAWCSHIFQSDSIQHVCVASFTFFFFPPAK